jgi:hypothetical protein
VDAAIPLVASGGAVVAQKLAAKRAAVTLVTEAAGAETATGAEALALPSGESSLLNQIRQAGGTLEVPRGSITAQDLAAAARASGNEIALYRDLETGQRLATEVGPLGGDIPANVRLILHVQPGEGPMSVIPSAIDRETLSELGQKSSVVINSGGDHSIRFGPTNVLDQPIRPINP